jgi:hypothetical protein
MFKRVLVFVTAMVLVLAMGVTAASAEWIKTGDGHPANGRAAADHGSALVGYAYYGEQVQPEGQSVNGYTYLVDKGFWVLTKFLINHDPGEFVPGTNKGTNEGGSSSSGGSSRSSGQSSGQAQGGDSAEYNAARWVTPYQVTTYHKRSSGVINMRWAPNKKSVLIQSYNPGTTLTVLCELKTWSMVQDPQTGKVGFIRSDFLQK